MATIGTLLYGLGFDISGMPAQVAAAKGHLSSIAQAANNIAPAATAADRAIRNLESAVTRLNAASRGSVTRELNSSITQLTTVAGASTPVLRSFALAADAISDSTESAVAVNAFARSASAAGTAFGGAVPQIVAFNQAMVQVAASGGEAAMLRVAAAVKAGENPWNAIAAETRAAGWAAQEAARAEGLAAGSLNAADGAALRAAGAFRQVAAAEDMAANRGSFLNRTLSMAFAFSGGVAVTNVFSFLANALVGFNSRLEQAHIAFTTLLGDSGRADAFIEKMKQFANVTPFTFASLQDAVQRLLAMGFAADSVLPALRSVGDAVAALGGDTEKLDRVTLALGQMITAGRVNSQDMRQLTEAGIPAWDILSKAIGKTVAETRKLAEQGLIPAGDAVSALLAGMEAKFSGMMARQARTAQGAASTIFDALTQITSNSVQPLFDAISKGMVALADFLVGGGGKVLIPAIQAIGVAIGIFLIPRIYGVAEAAMAASIQIEGLGVAFTRLPLSTVVIGLTAIAYAWQENFGGIRDTLGPIVKGITDFAGAILKLAQDSGLLVPVIEFLVTLISVRFVGALIAAGLAMAGDTIVAIGLAGAFNGLALDAGGAAVAVGGFGAMAGRLLPIIGGVAGVIGLWIGILVVVATKWDELARGVNAAAFVVIAAIKGIYDALLRLGGFSDQVINKVDEGFNAMLDHLTKNIVDLGDKINAASAQAGLGANAADPFAGMADKFKIDAQAILGQTQDLVTQFGTTIQGIVEAAKTASGEAMRQMAQTIMARQTDVVSAFSTLRDAFANQLTPTQEIARLVGIQSSAELQMGLLSDIPGVRAAAEALNKTVTERLDELTGNAYSAGLRYDAAYEAGIAAGKYLGPPAPKPDMSWKPSIQATTDAMKQLNAELAKTANSQAISSLSSAFSEIRQTAHQFFDQLHQDNLRAIDEALRHKNAIIDAKEALNQAPVDAAQRALDFQRRQIEEWRLRNAVATAQDPEAYRDAVLALQDFLAQQHINDMQATVNQAKDKLDAQKQANEDRASAQRDAENQRYNDQVAAFDRDLNLLQQHLSDEQGSWQTGMESILSLLRGYGVDFASVGATLGSTFTLNLQDQVDAAIRALKQFKTDLSTASSLGAALAAGGSALGAGSALGSALGSLTLPKIGSYAIGAWELNRDQVAFVHRGEMIVPPEQASLLRQMMATGTFGSPSRDFGAAVSGFAQTMHGTTSTGSIGGGTVVLKIGDETLGEITDRRLSVQDDIYGEPRQPDLSGVR